MKNANTASGIFSSIAGLWGIAVIILVWEVAVRIAQINPIVMPRPSGIALDIAGNPGLYLTGTTQTLLFAAFGLAIGMLIGTVLAVLTWLSRILTGLVTPLAIIFASVPVVALIPVLARIFGYDMRTVLAIVAIISFFPAFVFTTSGLRALPAGSDDLFKVLGVNTFRRLLHLALPAAVPDWAVGLRLAAANAILAAIVAEFLMGTSGLGFIFAEARGNLDMVRALGASAIAAVISVLAFIAASSFEKWARDVRQ